MSNSRSKCNETQSNIAEKVDFKSTTPSKLSQSGHSTFFNPKIQYGFIDEHKGAIEPLRLKFQHERRTSPRPTSEGWIRYSML